jgi:hypothetical protein
MRVEVGWTSNFHATGRVYPCGLGRATPSGGGRERKEDDLGQGVAHYLRGPVETRNPHVPLSLGRDGSYFAGRLILVETSVGG